MQFDWRFEPQFPNDLRDLVLPFLRQVEHLIPRWLRFCTVAFETEHREEEKGSFACTLAMSEYRYAKLSIFPLWFEREDEYRLHNLRHEVSHWPIHQLSTFTDSLLQNLVTDENMRALLAEQLRIIEEGAAEDLAYMLEAAGHGHQSN